MLIGIGMFFFTSANWAWAVGLTPLTHAARFLGLTNIATAGTMVITSLLGPLISLLNAQSTGRGFTFMFVVAIIGFLMEVGTRAWDAWKDIVNAQRIARRLYG